MMWCRIIPDVQKRLFVKVPAGLLGTHVKTLHLRTLIVQSSCPWSVLQKWCHSKRVVGCLNWFSGVSMVSQSYKSRCFGKARHGCCLVSVVRSKIEKWMQTIMPSQVFRGPFLHALLADVWCAERRPLESSQQMPSWKYNATTILFVSICHQNKRTKGIVQERAGKKEQCLPWMKFHIVAGLPQNPKATSFHIKVKFQFNLLYRQVHI